MAVIRVERKRDYTVMSNHHLKNEGLSLRAKGLLSMILSLPDNWNYSTRGLASICKEGVDAIGKTLRELESAGYIIRNQLRGSNGRITDTEYVIYEQPQDRPDMPPPDTASPDTEKPDMVSPDTVNPAQLNTKVFNTQKENTQVSITHSIPFLSEETAAAPPPEANGSEATLSEYELFQEIVRENISYDILCLDKHCSIDQLDEVVELMVETICSKRKTVRVAGNDFPHEIVKSRLLKLDSEHIRFVFDCLRENTSKVRNIKQYLLATLFNAPTTIGNYYSSLVNHDMYGSQ
ncbi:helix-turn-helix domain-containing protein [Christensenellaceae bacterium OttesenSCG-928-L17]|nr:helix-turn-helix domain-containing protein [Christensenellaceae bacterium OttesenSCG-928-L17]